MNDVHEGNLVASVDQTRASRLLVAEFLPHDLATTSTGSRRLTQIRAARWLRRTSCMVAP